MRKLIRHAAVAVVAWAVVTFAWAAVSHATGAIGPAQASSASLGLVADAIDFLRPPALLSAPQRFTAARIRNAAHNAEHLHRGPERVMARLMDRMGHSAAHRGDRRRHRHGRRGARASGNVVIHLDQMDRSADQWRRRAQMELERHRGRLERDQERAQRRGEQVRERVERRIERVERIRERAQERAHRIERIHVDRANRIAEAVASQMAEFEGLALRFEDGVFAPLDGSRAGISDDDKERLKRKGLEKLREILEGLSDEMGNVRVDLLAELESLDLDGMEFGFGDFDFDGDFDVFVEEIEGAESPVRIRIDRDR